MKDLIPAIKFEEYFSGNSFIIFSMSDVLSSRSLIIPSPVPAPEPAAVKGPPIVAAQALKPGAASAPVAQVPSATSAGQDSVARPTKRAATV